MNCTVPEAAVVVVASVSDERIETVQDIRNAMFNEGRSNLSNSDDAKSTILELFPWVSEFKKMCKCIYVDKTMASLAELMQYYIRNVNVSISDCYTKPLRAAKLKDSISETLPLFLYIYRELSVKNYNRSIYLNNMSDLLAMYIDMELKASKRSKEDYSTICTRLTSCLYVYLEHSTEHLLDTLIKMQLMCRGYHRILDPIITKIINNIPAHPDSHVMFVRYLLIYCLWRKVNSDKAMKSQITTTAIASLGAPPAAFPPCVLEDVLPKVPKCQPNSARYLMQQKFDIKKCCELFIQLCRESRGGTWQEENENEIVIPSSSNETTSELLGVISLENEIANWTENNCTENNFSLVPFDKDTQNNLVSSSIAEQTSVKPLGTISTNISRTISKPIKPKLLSRKKAKKSNKIVVIDLTTDIVVEKRIKKRTSPKKVAWLEEARKLDKRAIRASQMMKIQQMAEGVNSLKRITLDHQLEDLLQPVHATENALAKSDWSASATRDTKLDNDQVKSRQNCEAERRNAVNGNTVFAKQPVDANSSDKRIVQVPCAVSTVIVDRPQSDKSKAATKSLLDVPKGANNTSKRHDAASEASNTEKTVNRHNAQTVIKRLIEKDTPAESEACKRAESLRKICDLGTEHSKTVNTPPAIRALGDSKDGDDSSNRNATYLSTTKDKLSPHIVSSLVHARHGSNDGRETVNGTIENIRDNEKCTQERTRKMINDATAFSRSIRIDGDSSKGDFAVAAKTTTTTTTTAETRSTTTTSSNAVLINDATGSEQLRRSYITTEHKTKQPKESESQDEYVSARHDIANNTVSLSITSGDHSNVQTDLEVGTCIEISDNVRDSEISNCKIRETIFENHTDRTDKTSISSVLDVSLCSKEERVDSEKDINSARTAKKKDAPTDRFNAEEERNVQEELRSSVLCAQVEKKLRDLDQQAQREKFKTAKESCKISHTKDVEDLSGDKCIIQDSDLQDNIDGLSLLAVVSQRYSQHVPRVKPNELKCEHIKVKDYASLRNSPCNQTTDDEADTNDSSNTASQFLENPTTEVINRIVGIYPEDALDKVALHVEVTSTTDVTPEVTPNSRENDASNNVPHIVETINYEADALSSNLSMVENNVQSIKENTNVILNGETVVLLQKAPNLYIINKAVENARDHNSDDENCSAKEKNWIPPEDCASFEVVNMSEHISFNLDLPQYSKELSCQESKFSVGRSKGIKVEPEEEGSLMNVAEMKSYGKKGSLSADALPAASQIYQDTSVASVNTSKSTDKRKSILTYRQNIKQEFNNHIAQNCANCVQGSNGIHSRDVIDPQHSLHIPVTHPTTISSIYGNCAASTDLYMPYRKHCAVSCSFEINSTTSLHSHTKSANSYGSSHCSCVNCTYMFAHYRQCMHPTTDSHSCIESNSYFLPAHTSVQTSTVQEHDRAKSEAAMNKLYDDQLLSKIEQQILQNNTLEEQCEQNKFFKKDVDNKLPLKKRLKMRLKKEKLDSYPGVPMMSIADIEMLDGTQKHPSQVIKSSYELSPNEGNSPHDSYFSSNIGVRQNRKDYYKDMRISNLHQNLPKESARNNERQFRPSNDQPAVCLDTCQNRVFKTPAQRRDVTITNPTSEKRITPEPEDSVCKKAKKSQSSRQTRSSKRNVPKVNYCYTDVDPEWNPSGESKRRRKKTSR